MLDRTWREADNYGSDAPSTSDVLLLIEVAEPSLRDDRPEKARLYAEAGAANYGIVNLVDGCVKLIVSQRAEATLNHFVWTGWQIRPLAIPKVSHVLEIDGRP